MNILISHQMHHIRCRQLSSPWELDSPFGGRASKVPRIHRQVSPGVADDVWHEEQPEEAQRGQEAHGRRAAAARAHGEATRKVRQRVRGHQDL